ncbi:hypothetical protein HPP92_022216 [Vanilla planifolia]|uniref:dCTP pyrophosphatase 1 n=1 Tax=Vanilla planifolia TaxID=51239 RepID=A0A835UBQ2_VANPL|nr:hypothetical protein HPP92_022216 [Vanilla planifolia]
MKVRAEGDHGDGKRHGPGERKPGRPEKNYGGYGEGETRGSVPQPRNLLLALVGEVGKLSEIFQWMGEVPKGLPDWNEEEKEHLGEELSGVLLHLVRLSDICGVDLGKAALRKLELNARKYPVHQCRGSSKKHTHYSNDPKPLDESLNVVVENAGANGLDDC